KTYKITATLLLKEDVETQGWAINIFPKFRGKFHWTPHLSPDDGYIISDHVFRAPALILTSDDKLLTLIPDLEAREKSEYRWYMDLDVEENKMVIGLSDYVVQEHVLFKKAEQTRFNTGELYLSFYLMIDDSEEAIKNPWRRPLAFMWKKYGEELYEKGEPIKGTLEPYVKHTYNWAFNTWEDVVWQEFELNGKKVGAPVFIVNFTQSPNYTEPVNEREFRSIWNQAWFNSFRSAQGLYRYGKRTNNKEYIQRAQLTKELALSFPQKNGLFPGVIATEMEKIEIDGKSYNRSKGWEYYYYGNSNRNPFTHDSRISPLHILDMSCTAYYMLCWYDELEKDERLLEYARNYGDGLLKYQDEKGFFPAWISPETYEPFDILAQSPETSKSVTFLLKLAEITNDNKYLDAAIKAMEAVITGIIPIGQWEDFETYWSCNKWGNKEYVGKKIPRNNMFKQNTLSIYWTAEALINSYKLTGKKRFLELGQRTIDELLMAQAVWQPPYMYVPVFGGFGVMNADGEWNDSRQALFSELIIRYGKTLELDEYVQRGVAAIKASFSMMYCSENPTTKEQWEIRFPFFNEKDYGFMMENYGHEGTTSPEGGGIGGFTIYDWGNGAASEAYNKIVDFYGIDIFY
ncbi:MAG: hypothetical protein PHX54_10345, partial [Lentimicrobiaceae bacterium]|nr:hypothetical protein [Lentimicrobiaceae bacterium]